MSIILSLPNPQSHQSLPTQWSAPPAPDAGVAAGGKAPVNVAQYQRRAHEIMMAQGPQVAQTAFMLYMFVGNQLNLFSIFFLANMGSAPLRNLMTVSAGA